MSVFTRCLPLIVGGVLLGQAVALAVEAPPGRQTLKWWKSETFQKDLGLTSDQEDRIDAIFMETLPELRQSKDELDRLESQVSRLIETDTADRATLTRWIEKTESARGRLNVTRTLMLIRMRQVLTPDQRVRFKALQERYDRARHPLDSRRPPEASATTK